jgi:glycosyltransferase involved in cell wall biosynthesis
MKPLITALVDTYNHEKYIEQALVSVLEQGLSPAELEIVVVDDGSTDGTGSIVQKFAPRVKHVRKKNGGQASAFNAGFAESRGEIVAILDGDDWWAEGKLRAVVDALERNRNVAAVGHGHWRFDDETKEMEVRAPAERQVINLATAEATRAAIPLWGFLLMGALTVRRSLLERIMPLPEEMVFMADTPIQAAAMAMGTLVLEEPLFYYRYHAQNLYAIEAADVERLRRKYAMTELVHERAYRMLLDLGVSVESAATLLNGTWMDARRWRLQRFGGKRREAYQTEMQAFHAEFKNPSVAYRLFKYVVVGGATLVLPPRRFYGIREWYAQRELGRVRDRVARQDVAASKMREELPQK